jgi:hypothetical protein
MRSELGDLGRMAIVVFVCVSVITAAHATTTYRYTGNSYTSIPSDDDPPSGTYTMSMRIAGSFTVNQPLPMMALADISGLIISYSFDDGRNVLT